MVNRDWASGWAGMWDAAAASVASLFMPLDVGGGREN